jgi:hypothetical protein
MKIVQFLSNRAVLPLVLVAGFAASSATAQTPSSPTRPTRVRTNLAGFELSPKAGKSANQVGGASRDLGTPKLFAPNLGKSYTTLPDFHWAAAQAGDKVTFRLSTADGQVLYETPTTEGHLKYPADAPPLTPGNTYQWTVVPENDMLGGPPPPVTFMIVTDAERTAIASELRSASSPAAMTQVFVNHRVWYDSVQGYSDILASKPSDQDARISRAQLYDQLPATKSLADADWAMVH